MKRLAVAGVMLLGALACYSIAIEPYRVVPHTLEVRVAGLPEPFDGFRLLHLSDLESEKPGRRERQIEAIAARERPDAIVVTGDLVSKHGDREQRLASYGAMSAWLASLHAPEGVWFVQGHGEREAWVPSGDLRRILSESGVRTLHDELAILSRGGTRVVLAGLKIRDYGREGAWLVEPSSRARLGPTSRSSYLELAVPEEGGPVQELSGRLRFGSRMDAVGVMLRSRLGEGEERMYLIQRHRDAPDLTISARGSRSSCGRRNRRPMPPGIWLRFRARAETLEGAVEVKARVWADGESEPAEWDLECRDTTPGRIATGRAGLYAKGPGLKEFDDLRWQAESSAFWREPRGSDIIARVTRGAPPGVPVILLSHTPDIFHDAAASGIPLVLAGHTQGGQIRIPFFGALLTSTQLGRRYAEGVFQSGPTTLFITRGVGTTRLPLRLLAPPEASLITLRPAG